jgi:redox-sensitive bicupin YhaK (pirin superfamily)
MVAGRGIVHSERERPEVTAIDHRLHGLQLWLALPDSDEETEPFFHHYSEQNIPKGNIEGVVVKVMIGTAWGMISPVKTHSGTLCAEAVSKTGQTLQIPDSLECAVYVVDGSLQSAGTKLAAHSMAVVSGIERVSVTAEEDSRVVVIGGEPVGQRFIEWNFVSSSKERIQQAKNDWREGRFARVYGDEEAFIPLP